MKLTEREVNKDVPVMVFNGDMIQYGVIIGSSDNLIGILLNTGDYIDAPANKVRKLHKFSK
ncbi:hypothetical protein [Clostridium sp. HBUAS56010]|uniref:hypothetical protein n=1 Tax=Clostridium sp. HBUAS56010 TaxID=2571127 RepID=UPI0011781A23|nr:hypothetical protein [Clostridium sp. HBUAS56010]